MCPVCNCKKDSFVVAQWGFFSCLYLQWCSLSLSSGRGSSSFCSSPGSSNSTVYWIYIVHNISGTRYPKLTAKWVLKRQDAYDFPSFFSAYLITKNYTTVHEICLPEFGKIWRPSAYYLWAKSRFFGYPRSITSSHTTILHSI